jgi:hypothetical protein
MKEVGLSLQEAMMAFDKVFVVHLSAHENFCCMVHINLMSFFHRQNTMMQSNYCYLYVMRFSE